MQHNLIHVQSLNKVLLRLDYLLLSMQLCSVICLPLTWLD